MPAQALAAVVTLLSFAPHGNRVEMTLDRGSAEVVWQSARAFHLRRTLDGPLGALKADGAEPVALLVDETSAGLRMRSALLDVTIDKYGLLVHVKGPDGEVLMNDLSEARAEGGQFTWQRQAPAGGRFYGLGPRAETGFELSGRALTTDVPFLISTTGYTRRTPAAGSTTSISRAWGAIR
jgi:hypothetical protein